MSFSDTHVDASRFDLAATAPSSGSSPLGHELFNSVVNALEAGIVVCDGAGHPRFMNSAAEHQVADGAFLRLKSGKLCGTGDAGALTAGMAAACARGTRRMVPLTNGDRRIYAAVSPVQDACGNRAALLLLGSANACSPLSMELLGIGERLTAAERQVLSELAAYRPPVQIARERLVTLATVRTQIATIYAKLGVRSMQELLCLVGSAPSLSYQCGRSSHIAAPASVQQDVWASRQAATVTGSVCQARIWHDNVVAPTTR